MRALIQRVERAQVRIDGSLFSEIGRGLLVYVGVHRDDTEKDLEWTAKKILQARVFANEQGKMSGSVSDIRGQILLVSQITLYGDLLKGNRPDMSKNRDPREAQGMYEKLAERLRTLSGLVVQTGRFGAHMDIHSVNHGPVTLWLDSFPAENPGPSSPGVSHG